MYARSGARAGLLRRDGGGACTCFATLAVFLLLRTIGYELDYGAVAWPPAWQSHRRKAARATSPKKVSPPLPPTMSARRSSRSASPASSTRRIIRRHHAGPPVGDLAAPALGRTLCPAAQNPPGPGGDDRVRCDCTRCWRAAISSGSGTPQGSRLRPIPPTPVLAACADFRHPSPARTTHRSSSCSAKPPARPGGPVLQRNCCGAAGARGKSARASCPALESRPIRISPTTRCAKLLALSRPQEALRAAPGLWRPGARR